jgi:hypothetical protein
VQNATGSTYLYFSRAGEETKLLKYATTTAKTGSASFSSWLEINVKKIIIIF